MILLTPESSLENSYSDTMESDESIESPIVFQLKECRSIVGDTPSFYIF